MPNLTANAFYDEDVFDPIENILEFNNVFFKLTPSITLSSTILKFDISNKVGKISIVDPKSRITAGLTPPPQKILGTLCPTFPSSTFSFSVDT